MNYNDLTKEQLIKRLEASYAYIAKQDKTIKNLIEENINLKEKMYVIDDIINTYLSESTDKISNTFCSVLHGDD